MNIVETHMLSKRYGAKAAVTAFNMQVHSGDIYGFVGRNGAGKSTVMKMLSGLATPTSGEIKLFNKSIRHASGEQKLGILIENPGLYPSMSAYDNLMLKCLCAGTVNPKKTTNQLLDFVGLANVDKKQSKHFSMGMKQRLGLALALVGDPQLLLLDEPLNGLDPEGVREIRQLIIKLNEEHGLTVIISSHVLEQLGKMANRYGIIRDGQMVCEITAEEVTAQCSEYLHLETNDANKALVIMQEKFPNLKCIAMPQNAIRIQGFANAALIGEAMSHAGIAVSALYTHNRDIEDFFVEKMGGN